MSNRFNYVKRGYDPAEVDSYIEVMESVIKSYKEKDAAIKNAILNAQIAADGMILNAKNQVREIKENTIRQITDIKNSVSVQKEMLKSFQDEYTNLLNKYMHTIKDNDLGAVKNKIYALENYLEKFAQYGDAAPAEKDAEPKAEDKKANKADPKPEQKPEAKSVQNKISSQEQKELLG